MIQMNRIANTMAKGPQSGASTHHHAQVMILHSFSVMKIKPRIAQNGKLLEVVF